jgi:hypothetical protein
MHDHRQVELPRKIELGGKVTALQLGIETLDVKVQPDFAHRHRIAMRQPAGQLIDVSGRVIRQKHRMQPVCRINVCAGTGQGPDARPAGRIDGGQHHRGHPRREGAGHHRIAVIGKSSRIEMHMAVGKWEHDLSAALVERQALRLCEDRVVKAI